MVWLSGQGPYGPTESCGNVQDTAVLTEFADFMNDRSARPCVPGRATSRNLEVGPAGTQKAEIRMRNFTLQQWMRACPRDPLDRRAPPAVRVRPKQRRDRHAAGLESRQVQGRQHTPALR